MTRIAGGDFASGAGVRLLSRDTISMRGVNPFGSAPRLQAIEGWVAASVSTVQLGTTTTLTCNAAACFDDDGPPAWPGLDACDRAAPVTIAMATAAATGRRIPLLIFSVSCQIDAILPACQAQRSMR